MLRAVLAVSLAAGLLVYPAGARPLGVRLTGQELLIEYDQTGAGSAPPGIYAVTEDGGLTRVITRGGSPCWAPSRTRFAYTAGGATWVADVRQQRCEAIDEARTDLLARPPGTALALAPPAVAWLPDERAVLRWGTVSTGAGTAIQPLAFPVRPDQGDVEPLLDTEQTVGAVSFAPDGRLCAHESFRYVDSLGALDRRVVLRAVRDAAVAVQQPLPIALGSLLNPRWSPADAILAIDVIDAQFRRSAGLWDSRSGAWTPLALPPGGASWTSVVAWSRSGRRLLAISGNPASGSANLWLFDVSTDRQTRIAKLASNLPYVHWACWSPDQTRVATLGGQTAQAEADHEAEVQIVGAADGGSRYLEAPAGLVPVRIDW